MYEETNVWWVLSHKKQDMQLLVGKRHVWLCPRKTRQTGPGSDRGNCRRELVRGRREREMGMEIQTGENAYYSWPSLGENCAEGSVRVGALVISS